jgi:hypothetical protein
LFYLYERGVEMDKDLLKKMNLPDEIRELIDTANNVVVPENRQQLFEMSLGGASNSYYEVEYEVQGSGVVTEATVTRCKNGLVINYPEAYMRRRDPNSMVIADDLPTDKPKFKDLYGKDFSGLKQETLNWLGERDIIVMPFMAGGSDLGYPALLVAPGNAGFFAAGLADLQEFIPKAEIPENFTPRAVIYLAPPFRHTHFDGKQIVVHNRRKGLHELFCYNVYPGPSAKKGVYSVLLNIGEEEGWTTVHASAVKVITPYENVITILHEGASGGGKSEMTEKLHKEEDGLIMLGRNTITNEKVYLELKETCDLEPVADDMAICHPSLQSDSKKLVVKDAEYGWFLRIDHITHYGTDPQIEKMSIHPKEPLMFINLQGQPDATCLIWEHTLDAPGKPCPNPRAIIPRKYFPNIVSEPVEIDIRTFGVRTPPCTKEKPTYGIIGMFHILPPALAWLWRLVSPRGHDNPSIIDTKGMSSEGVGSYWPFATGRMVDQANLLLEQIMNTPSTRYLLIPNQNIGAYKVGFMSQWIAREYIARRGSAKFRPEQIVESRCPLLGYSLETLKVDGQYLPKGFLQPAYQPEVGFEGYDKGAQILSDFFKREISKYLSPDLHPLGRQIIETCLNDGTIDDYIQLMPIRL